MKKLLHALENIRTLSGLTGEVKLASTPSSLSKANQTDWSHIRSLDDAAIADDPDCFTVDRGDA